MTSEVQFDFFIWIPISGQKTQYDQMCKQMFTRALQTVNQLSLVSALKYVNDNKSLFICTSILTIEYSFYRSAIK